MEDPTILFGLISGGDIPLVEFDSGPLTLGFQFQKSFGPIYAPPPVMMVVGGGASVTLRIAAGFDTYGIRRAIETGDGAQVLDSLYFKTVDNNGGRSRSCSSPATSRQARRSRSASSRSAWSAASS